MICEIPQTKLNPFQILLSTETPSVSSNCGEYFYYSTVPFYLQIIWRFLPTNFRTTPSGCATTKIYIFPVLNRVQLVFELNLLKKIVLQHVISNEFKFLYFILFNAKLLKTLKSILAVYTYLHNFTKKHLIFHKTVHYILVLIFFS